MALARQEDPPGGCGAYRRRAPEGDVLQRVLTDHLQTFLARVDADETRRGLPGFVRRELYRYLECGVLVHG